ncbi:hypothetical protein D623_10000761 [Myotis brandtii]|uniref:Uncharacterized protein n=1 Tax=Myotis brandtii TaxID=109478 RepID=S7PK02_MYOBR|nr:hypothetical protein D623_10000761 [Myotis brandtii]
MGTIAPAQAQPIRSCGLGEQVEGIAHSLPGPGTPTPHGEKPHVRTLQAFSSPPQAGAQDSQQLPVPPEPLHRAPSAEPRWLPPCLHPYLLLALLSCLEHGQVVGPAGLLGFLVLLPQCLPEHWEGTRPESPSGGGRGEVEGPGNTSHLWACPTSAPN